MSAPALRPQGSTRSVQPRAAFRVLIVGECGDGKSTLTNNLLGYNAAATGLNARGVTKNIYEYPANMDRFVNGKPLVVVDSPGVGDKDVTAMQLLSLLEASLAGFQGDNALDCVIVTSPVPAGRVKLGAQVVQALVDKGFVGDEKWKNIVFVGTKTDRAEQEEIDFFSTKVAEDFFQHVPADQLGQCVLSGKEDVAQVWSAMSSLSSSKVGYEQPAAHIMAECLAEKLGIEKKVFEEKLLEERRKAEEAAKRKPTWIGKGVRGVGTVTGTVVGAGVGLIGGIVSYVDHGSYGDGFFGCKDSLASVGGGACGVVTGLADMVVHLESDRLGRGIQAGANQNEAWGWAGA